MLISLNMEGMAKTFPGNENRIQHKHIKKKCQEHWWGGLEKIPNENTEMNTGLSNTRK